MSWASPPGYVAVDPSDFFITERLSRHSVRFLDVHHIPHADWNLLQVVEHIQLSNHQPGDAVNHASVAKERQIEPAGTPGTSCDGAEFVAALAQIFSLYVEKFARERTAADAGAIGFGDTDDRVNRRRRHAGSCCGATGSRARRRHERISAVINIEHGALLAFEDDRLPFRQS